MKKEKYSEIFEKLDDPTLTEKLKEFYKKIKNKEPKAICVLVVVTLVVVILLSSFVGSMTGGQADKTSEDAYMLLSEGKYDEAIEVFTYLQEKEEWPIWTVSIADVYAIKGEYQKADMLLEQAYMTRCDLLEEDYDRYIERDEEFVNRIMYNFIMIGNIDESLSLGEDYLKDGKKHEQLIKTMIPIYISKGDMEKANNVIELYDVDKTSAYDMAVVAHMEMVTEDYEKGFEFLLDAFELDKNEFKVFDVIEDVAYYNNYEVIEKLKEKISVTGNQVYELLLAKVYSESEDTLEESEIILKDLEETFGDLTTYKFISWENNSRLGNEEQAEEIMESINKDDESYITYNILANEALYKEDYDSALTYAQKSILSNMDYIDNFTSLIPYILIGKDEHLSESYFREAIYREPFNIGAIRQISDYYREYGSEDYEAREYSELALAIDKKNSDIYYDYALYMVEDGELERAIQTLQDAIEINPDKGDYHRVLGRMYFENDQEQEAIDSFREAYWLNENDIFALNNIACYYALVDDDIERALLNIEIVYEEANESVDIEDKMIIEGNYVNIKNYHNEVVNNGNTNVILKDLEMFY